MSPSLSVVADNQAIGAGASLALGDSLGDRIKRLQTEARSLAREHIQALEIALVHVERLSAEIADGGDAYPAGVREIARRLVEDCEVKVQALEAIVART